MLLLSQWIIGGLENSLWVIGDVLRARQPLPLCAPILDVLLHAANYLSKAPRRYRTSFPIACRDAGTSKWQRGISIILVSCRA